MTQSSKIDPRVAMWRRLPRWLQKFLTWLTGKAAPEEMEIFRHTVASRFSLTLLQYSLGILGSLWATHLGGLALAVVPMTTLMTAGAVRAFQTTFLHHGSHGTLGENPSWNKFLAETASTLGWLAPLVDYAADHGPHHADTATESDPDLRMVVKLLKVRPGLTRAEYWTHLRKLLVSPKLHVAMTLTRLRCNLVTAKGWRRVAAWVQGLGLLTLMAWAGFWLEFAVAYVLPVVLMYTIAAVLQTISEHTWVHLGQGEDLKPLIRSRLTVERYFGDMLPEEGARLRAWATFWARMFLIHLPLRVWIVPQDVVAHAWHHFHAKSREWPRYAFARRDDEARAEKAGTPYSEVWGGLAGALNVTFDHLALVPPDADLGKPESYGWIDGDLLGM